MINLNRAGCEANQFGCMIVMSTEDPAGITGTSEEYHLLGYDAV
jgi:hypothetical protein